MSEEFINKSFVLYNNGGHEVQVAYSTIGPHLDPNQNNR